VEYRGDVVASLNWTGKPAVRFRYVGSREDESVGKTYCWLRCGEDDPICGDKTAGVEDAWESNVHEVRISYSAWYLPGRHHFSGV
jgi:hypothetical protein